MTDVYHGQEVTDPYRWLEDTDAPVDQWVSSQNDFTEGFLSGLEFRTYYRERMQELIDYERAAIPQVRSGVLVYAFNGGLQEQDELRVTRDPGSAGQVIVDPMEFDADGTVSISRYRLSPDGRHLAYALSDGGSDWTRWRVRDVVTGQDLEETIRFTKFTDVSWSVDSSGFYYSRYPEAAAGGGDDQAQVSIWFHRLGDEQDSDRLIYEADADTLWNPYGEVSEDGGWLIITLSFGWESNGIEILGLEPGGLPPGASAVPRSLVTPGDGLYQYMGTLGSEFLFHSSDGAENWHVVALRFTPAQVQTRVVVPESQSALEQATLVADNIIAVYTSDAHASVRIFGPGGISIREVELPGQGTVAGFEATPGSPTTFFSYTDFVTPESIFSYDVLTGDSEVFFRPETLVSSQALTYRQVFFKSADGTRVPMTIVRRTDVEPDGQLPAVLYGYGGFNVSLLPRYSTARLTWIASGGVYAVANLRGGGEYGEAWHQAGTKTNKQNVFDDFIGAAEWLIENGYTRPDRLAIWGGSNGGLLVGAVMNQRPELFSAAVPAVGVMDMLRFDKASANARTWGTEYGLSEVEEEFHALRAYSPYHNLVPGTCYPATLVMADTHDDRVVPWHSYKYAAALQAAQRCDRPTLIRIETRAGHGAGASVSKVVDEYADQWAFVGWALDHRPLDIP